MSNISVGCLWTRKPSEETVCCFLLHFIPGYGGSKVCKWGVATTKNGWDGKNIPWWKLTPHPVSFTCSNLTSSSGVYWIQQTLNKPYCLFLCCLWLWPGTVQNFDEFSCSCSHAGMQVGLMDQHTRHLAVDKKLKYSSQFVILQHAVV